MIDFTSPATSVTFAGLAAQARIVHVIGTTGCSSEDEEKFKAASRHARIVKSGNMSLGVNLLSVLTQQAAQALDAQNWDIEILEMHHKHKVDAPSGTALLLGEAAAAGRKVDLAASSVRVRDGHTGARETGTIGFATLRGGSVIGEHSVIFAGEESAWSFPIMPATAPSSHAGQLWQRSGPSTRSRASIRCSMCWAYRRRNKLPPRLSPQFSTVNSTVSAEKRLMAYCTGTPSISAFSAWVTSRIAPGDNSRSARSCVSAWLAEMTVEMRT